MRHIAPTIATLGKLCNSRNLCRASLVLLCSCTVTTPDAIVESTAPDAANASYGGITDAPVTLMAGRHEGQPIMAGAASRDVVHLLQGSGVTADLDADGVDEAVVLLEHDATGSGRFIYLGVVNHNVAIAATRLIGDRVQVMTLNAGTAGVAAQVLRAGEDDAACCPGEKARLTWQYSMADGLSRARETVVGRLSRADLLGSWRLLSFHGAAPSQIFTLVIEPDSIGGRTPCAGYAGTMAMGDGPGAIVLRARAATAAECKDDTARPARRYLEALNDVVQFAFAPGQLVLEGPNGALVFSRATVDQASVR